MTDAPELKPCPFCGGEASAQRSIMDGPTGAPWMCGCDREMSDGTWDGCVTLTWYSTKAEAIAAWNTRADLATPDPRVTALMEAAQWARNRLELIADESWHGDGRDLKRSIIGVFADFDAALLACGSSVPAALRDAKGEGE
jgi:hypothetical protein